ncbi:MAG: hypothetical protein AB7P37_18990 [Ramlibacter sp.]
MDLRTIELEMTRALLWYAAVMLLGYIVSMYVLYLVIRYAIRDGIRDSGLTDRWRRISSITPRLETDTMPPDMTAER